MTFPQLGNHECWILGEIIWQMAKETMMVRKSIWLERVYQMIPSFHFTYKGTISRNISKPNVSLDLWPIFPHQLIGTSLSCRTIGKGGHGQYGNTGYTTPEDWWARVERDCWFQGRAGPRPSLGNTPSNRGRWGRSRYNYHWWMGWCMVGMRRDGGKWLVVMEHSHHVNVSLYYLICYF